MRKGLWNSLRIAGCACLLTITAAVAGHQAAHAQEVKSKAGGSAIAVTWATETLSGQVMTVDTAKKLLIVKGPNGVPFDLQVTPSTRISFGSQRLTLKDLAADQQKTVSVRFVPERAGDVARSIEVKG